MTLTPSLRQRRRTAAAALALSFAAGVLPVAAQEYPSRPIRLIVPLAAGSTADISSRFAGEQLARLLGQPVVIENKPAAGGTVAMAETARAAPDGYTIAFASQGTLVFNQAIYARPGYDSQKDFRPISLIGGVSNVLVVPPTSTARTPAELIALAKANPGLTYSSGGNGTSHHLCGVLFARQTGTDLLHVPYKGAPAGILAVMSGEVAMGCYNTPTVISQVKEGKLRALAVTSLTRSPLLAGVGTLDEQGVKGFEVNTWFGFVAPAGTPDAVVDKLGTAFNRIFASAEARDKLAPMGFDLAPPNTPASFGKLIADDLTRWVPVVKASGAKAD